MGEVYQVSTRWAAGTFGPGRPGGGEEGLAILVSSHPIAESHGSRELPEARADRAPHPASRPGSTPRPGRCGVTPPTCTIASTDGVARERPGGRHRRRSASDLVRAPTAPHSSCAATSTHSPDADEIRFLRGLCTPLAGRRTHFQDAWLRVHPGASSA